MRLLLKYLLWFFSSLTLLFFYLFATHVGNWQLSLYLSDYLSQKSHNKIRISHFSLEHYPLMEGKMRLNDRADLTLKGSLNDENISMQYHLWGDSFSFNKIHLEDKIDIQGELSGRLSHLRVKGKGIIFDGLTDYQFIQEKESFEEVDLHLYQVSSQKIFKFLKKKPMIQGRVDINASFVTLSKLKKEGEVDLFIPKGRHPLLETDLVIISNIKIKDNQYHFNSRVNSALGKVILDKGSFESDQKLLFANYHVDIPRLSDFESYLKHKYKGSLQTSGTVRYADKKLEIQGKTDKFEGKLNYIYHQKKLDLDLEGVSMVKLLEQYNYPALVDAKVFGTINYNLMDKIALIDTKLRHARFRRTKVSDILRKTTGIDLLSHVYDQSSFIGGYQNNLLSATLKIDDGKEHLYLKDIKMNSKTNKLNSKFEIKMQGQEFSGDIYGTLKNPKVSLDMSRLLKYQVDKQFGNILGNSKKKKIKKEINEVKRILKDVDVDEVKKKAKSLLRNLF